MIDIEGIIIRYISGDATAEEKQKLLSWISENPDNEQQLFLLKDINEAGESANLSVEAKTEDEWRKIIARVKPKQNQPKRFMMQARKYVAMFIIGAMFGSFAMYFYGYHSSETVPAIIAKTFEIRTEKGERATIHLPDGSKVVLNACSYLSYPADFGENAREMILTGEGFFDVKTKPDMPFTVKTSGLSIKAYGTVFNVKAYSDEDLVETTLVEGSVSIETQANKSIVSLKPAQVVTIPKKLISCDGNLEYGNVTAPEKTDIKSDAAKSRTEETVLMDKINPEVYTSWKDNKWLIESESLESLATKIERKYDVTVSLEDETVKNYVFSGTLKNYPLEQVLETIRLSAPIQYSVNEKNVVIREDKQVKKKYEKLIQSSL